MILNTLTTSLIENIPKANIPSEIDLVLDGGAFNGLYMLGCLFYLKELENREKLQIKRVSGCSIGSVLGLVFILNKLDVALDVCKDAFKYLRRHQDLKKFVVIFKERFNEIVDDSDISILNGRFYLTYFDAIKGKQIIKKTYQTKQDLLDCILKSLYVPYIIDRNITDRDGCIDGAFPYMFKKKEGKRKILFINLQSWDKIMKMLYIKNENNIYPRVFEGLMDAHNFFNTNKSNNLCSYVNDWGVVDIILFRMSESIYTVLIYILGIGLQLDDLIPTKWKNIPIIQKNMSIFKNLWRDMIMYISI